MAGYLKYFKIHFDIFETHRVFHPTPYFFFLLHKSFIAILSRLSFPFKYNFPSPSFKAALNFQQTHAAVVYPFLKNEYKYFYGDCFLSFPFYLYFALKLHKTKPLSVYIKKDPRYKANKAFYKILRKLFSRYKIGYCDF